MGVRVVAMATKCDAWIALKSVFGRDSAPHRAVGAHYTPTNPLVGWEGDVGVFTAAVTISKGK